jgi:SAM-dependent methyltransferase
VVLDYGCGPGHDTIGFLLNGAEHVYAVDFSSKALQMLAIRLRAHDLENRCTAILIDPRENWIPPLVDHIMLAGVLHHCFDPIGLLARLKLGLSTRFYPSPEIRMMVYNSDSWYYQQRCHGDPEEFRRQADAGAPIAKAWTHDEVSQMAAEAGLRSEHVGSYRVVGEPEGPGLSACYSLRTR